MENTKAKHSKEQQTLVLECKERVEAKEQLLRKKALEHGQKLLEKDIKWKVSHQGGGEGGEYQEAGKFDSIF